MKGELDNPVSIQDGLHTSYARTHTFLQQFAALWTKPCASKYLCWSVISHTDFCLLVKLLIPRPSYQNVVFRENVFLLYTHAILKFSLVSFYPLSPVCSGESTIHLDGCNWFAIHLQPPVCPPPPQSFDRVKCERVSCICKLFRLEWERKNEKNPWCL